mmetsp:Transcript_81100/g.229708  ORF Transcript_81100/g.229708 Transcript_81100/m.229708 type:complete len:247 (-) Transcript_81100:12-752(-)
MRFSPRSSREKVGTVWKRRHPTETSVASPLLSIFGCHLCLLTRTCTRPMRPSPGRRPPRMTGRSRRISATQAAGTSSRRTRTKAPMPMPSLKSLRSGMATCCFTTSALAEAFFRAPSASSPSPSAPPSFPSPAAASAPSSSSALLQPPVMNLRPLRASLAASSSSSFSPGSTGIRTVSTPSMSPRFPSRPSSFDFSCASSASSASMSSPSNSGTVLWSVAWRSEPAAPAPAARTPAAARAPRPPRP